MNENKSLVLIWASSDPDAQSCAKSLGTARKDNTQVCASPSEVRAALETQPETAVCLIYTAPARHMAHALEQGAGLEEAAAAWQAETTALLALHRQNRARCTLLESAHLRRFYETALTRLGLFASIEKSSTPAGMGKPSGAIEALVAANCLRDRPALAELAEELAASSTSLSNDANLEEPLDGQEALLTLRAQQTKAREQRQQIARLQDTLDALNRQLEDSRKTAEEAQADKTRLDSQIRTLEVRLAEATGGRDILQQQTAVLLGELRAATGQNQQQAQDIDRLKRDLGHQTRLQEDQARRITEIEADRDTKLNDLQTEIDRIMNSRSMRLTAPLRSVLRLLGRKPDV